MLIAVIKIAGKNCCRGTVEPQFNEPLYNKVLSITNYIFQPSSNKMYGK